MNKFTKFVKDFWQDEEGLTVVEYVVGAGLIVAALSVVFGNWGTTLETKLNSVFPSSGS
ncbi:Flp family type IVb pilin [Vibrio fluvialis]|uniref:Flp family type IVb pilin n=1 Tax=Vibrio fluvialis TaxID=676 RepID=UPI001EE9B266|nr:Flp family type IVb pilin [Vibrio fluvialis]MCG6348843.1 Flp family type IVb pilin [Vibrio fluvialis]